MFPIDYPHPPIEESYTVDLAPFLEASMLESLRQVGCQPVYVDIPQEKIEEIYALSDACLTGHFEEICALARAWEQEFASSVESIPWKNVRFGIRDKRTALHRQKDKKFYLQFCREYAEWVMRVHPEQLASIPALKRLFHELLDVEEVCQRVFIEKIGEIAGNCSEIEKLFYDYRSEHRVPISIRIISYEYEGDFSVSPHYDKAAMTLLLPSDDAPDEECLIIAPADGTGFDPDKLRRPIRPVPDREDTSCAVFITGSMLEYIGVPIPPTPHAVLPHDRKLRHVLVAFCNVPHIDTSHLSFAILHKKEMPSNFAERFKNRVKIDDNQYIEYIIRQ